MEVGQNGESLWVGTVEKIASREKTAWTVFGITIASFFAFIWWYLR
jgi:hypothetical protein